MLMFFLLLLFFLVFFSFYDFAIDPKLFTFSDICDYFINKGIKRIIDFLFDR